MNNMNNLGFKKLSYEDQKKINSAGSLSGFINGLSSFFSIGSSINKIAQQNKLLNQIKGLEKGELEFGKDGQIKIKWDNRSNTLSNTTIF